MRPSKFRSERTGDGSPTDAEREYLDSLVERGCAELRGDGYWITDFPSEPSIKVVHDHSLGRPRSLKAYELCEKDAPFGITYYETVEQA